MLELPPDLERQLREGAALNGQEIGEHILWLMDRYESRKKQAAEETHTIAAQPTSEGSEK
jgi:hypothetical protein